MLINKCVGNVLVKMFNDRTDHQHFFSNCGVYNVFGGFGASDGNAGVFDDNAGGSMLMLVLVMILLILVMLMLMDMVLVMVMLTLVLVMAMLMLVLENRGCAQNQVFAFSQQNFK